MKHRTLGLPMGNDRLMIPMHIQRGTAEIKPVNDLCLGGQKLCSKSAEGLAKHAYDL